MPHGGPTAVRTEFIAPKAGFTRLDAQRKEVPASLWGLNGSASVKDKQLVVTVVNPHHKEVRSRDRDSRRRDKVRREPHPDLCGSPRPQQLRKPERPGTQNDSRKRNRFDIHISVRACVRHASDVHVELTIGSSGRFERVCCTLLRVRLRLPCMHGRRRGGRALRRGCRWPTSSGSSEKVSRNRRPLV